MQVCVEESVLIILIACLHLVYFQESFQESITLFIYIYLNSEYFLQDAECQDNTTVNNKRQFAVKLHLC